MIKELSERFTVLPQNIGSFQCKVCMNINPEAQKILFCQSNHQLCQLCFNQYVKVQINVNLKQIKCPQQKCNNKLTTKNKSYQKLSQPVRKKYQKLIAKIQEIKQQIKYCPQCNIVLNNHQDSLNLFCQKCNRKICRQCLSSAHQFRGKCQFNVLFQLKQKFRQCPNCRYLVLKYQGCDHMVCICGHNFCYKCGKNRMNYHDHVCQVREQRKRSL